MKTEKGSFKLSTVALAIVAASTVFTAQAQEYTSEEKMVVVSSRTPKAISDIPGTVWYIDSDQIEQNIVVVNLLERSCQQPFLH